MRKTLLRLVSFMLTVVLVATGLIFAKTDDVKASANVTYTITTYGEEGTDYFGYILTPDVDHNVQALIYIHGNGGISKNGQFWPDRIKSEMEKWTALGYIEPMVVIVPKANIGDDNNQKGNKMKVFVDEQFETLLDSAISGSISSKIDTSKDVVVTGLSMGGAAALYAGVKFRSKVKNVGAFSPANDFKYYWDKTSGWVKDSEIIFSDEPNSHYLVGASLDENGGLHYAVAEHVYSVCGEKYGFKRYYLEGYEHTWDLFMMELFYYLYYVQNDVVPTKDMRTQAAAKDVSVLDGTVSISGTAVCGQTLTANVSESSATNLTYQWTRDGASISGATSKTYTLTASDVDKTIACEVRSSSFNGYIEGKMSSMVTKITGPDMPSGIETFKPSVLGAGDGKITGVDKTMEYSSDINFTNATPCTSNEITGLYAGDYYIRIAETSTTYAGTAKKVTVYPGPEKTNAASFEDLVERLYHVALNRDSDPDGLNYWSTEVGSGHLTGGDCAASFLISSEFLDKKLSNEEFIEVLYNTFFGRASDAEGKAYWKYYLDNKILTKEEIIRSFINSTEWCNICASYGVKSGAPTAKATEPSNNAKRFAERLYTKCLGRDAEEEGLMFWSLSLTNLEVTGTVAAYKFFTSQEFIGYGLSDDVYIERLYETFMGRASDAEGKAYWLNELKNGKKRDDVFYGFANSQEFEIICNSYGIER